MDLDTGIMEYYISMREIEAGGLSRDMSLVLKADMTESRYCGHG